MRPKTPPHILKLRRVTKALEQINEADVKAAILHFIKQMNYQGQTTAYKVGRYNRRLIALIEKTKDHLAKKPVPTPDYRLTSILKWEK